MFAKGYGLINRGINSSKVISVEFDELILDSKTLWKSNREFDERVLIEVNLEDAISSTEDAYLRLTLLSRLVVKPNSINLDNLYSCLELVVWTNYGGFLVDEYEVESLKIKEKFGSTPTIHSIDKFPRLVDFVIPQGVRIADASRVRLGAYLSPGTTIMHEGFCNFNAGTLGVSMVEGRISQGVTVDDGSDIGGGASIMGTLSGGGKEKVRIGKRSLLGANAGLGIQLGDDCVVESGLYITAGSKVLYDGEVIKAKELSGFNGILFIRNSVTGQVEAKIRKNIPGVELNPILHSN